MSWYALVVVKCWCVLPVDPQAFSSVSCVVLAIQCVIWNLVFKILQFLLFPTTTALYVFLWKFLGFVVWLWYLPLKVKWNNIDASFINFFVISLYLNSIHTCTVWIWSIYILAPNLQDFYFFQSCLPILLSWRKCVSITCLYLLYIATLSLYQIILSVFCISHAIQSRCTCTGKTVCFAKYSWWREWYYTGPQCIKNEPPGQIVSPLSLLLISITDVNICWVKCHQCLNDTLASLILPVNFSKHLAEAFMT